MKAIHLEINTTILNHKKIAKDKGGSLGDVFASLPFVKPMIENTIDAIVYEKIRAAIDNTLSATLKNELKKSGIDADVSVKFIEQE